MLKTYVEKSFYYYIKKVSILSSFDDVENKLKDLPVTILALHNVRYYIIKEKNIQCLNADVIFSNP